MTTMIALVGAQPLPNFLPVRHCHPDSVVLVYTTTTKQPYERQKLVLQDEVTVYGVETDPYDIPTIMKDLNKKLEEITKPASQPLELLFNLTGGTKTMSLAAYQVAQQRGTPMMYMESEGKRSRVYRYAWHNGRIIFANNEQEPEYIQEYITLEDVLDLHLGRGKDDEGKDIWKEKGPTVQSNGGHLFELAIAQVLKDHGYQVMCGVKGKNDQIDIDVMVRYQNHTGIIEAKMGKAKDLYGIKQLSTAMRYLGGIYTRQFLVIKGKPSDAQKMVCDSLRITIISLLQYQQNMTSLSPQDTTTLVTAIDKLMKVETPKS